MLVPNPIESSFLTWLLALNPGPGTSQEKRTRLLRVPAGSSWAEDGHVLPMDRGSEDSLWDPAGQASLRSTMHWLHWTPPRSLGVRPCFCVEPTEAPGPREQLPPASFPVCRWSKKSRLPVPRPTLAGAWLPGHPYTPTGRRSLHWIPRWTELYLLGQAWEEGRTHGTVTSFLVNLSVPWWSA